MNNMYCLLDLSHFIKGASEGEKGNGILEMKGKEELLRAEAYRAEPAQGGGVGEGI